MTFNSCPCQYFPPNVRADDNHVKTAVKGECGNGSAGRLLEALMNDRRSVVLARVVIFGFGRFLGLRWRNRLAG